jgi:hypothetical protein
MLTSLCGQIDCSPAIYWTRPDPSIVTPVIYVSNAKMCRLAQLVFGKFKSRPKDWYGKEDHTVPRPLQRPSQESKTILFLDLPSSSLSQLSFEKAPWNKKEE